jgi:6-phosphogluconolactonase/glucosamine-6-phosphate isomerase/deaminase
VPISFVKSASTEPVVTYLADVLTEHLTSGQPVLWLLSGGSAVPVAVAAAERLSPELLPWLTITLVDERYGPLGHKDSNWQALMSAGLPPGAKLLPVLTGASLAATVASWSKELDQAISAASLRLGLFGVGPDGHTSGILPNSDAVSATGTVYAYEGGGYERITTTFETIKRLDEAVVYAIGESKRPVLERLNEDIPLAVQPAQILKQLPKTTIFNDQIGEQA